MNASLNCWKFVVVLFAFFGMSSSSTVFSQESTLPAPKNDNTVVIQFKIFDANNPKIELRPKLEVRPIILLRNLDTKEEELFLGNKDSDITIKESKERKGFYEITLPKGRLINDLAIDVDRPRTNAAGIIKIVTANNIVVYPAASSAVEPFTFTAYVAQLNRYNSLLNQLTEQFPDRKAEIRLVLLGRYSQLLIDMKWVLDTNQVSASDPRQLEKARKVLNETLELYGLQQPNQVGDQKLVTEQCVTYYPSKCRPRLFGWLRKR